MSNVRRVYVEKKPAYAVQAKELKHEISSYLGIKSASKVRENGEDKTTETPGFI